MAKNPEAKKESPEPSPRAETPPKGKKGKKGKGKRGKGKKGKKSKNKKMTLLFYVNGRADTAPFKESKVKKNTITSIMQMNLHGEWEYRSNFVCDLNGNLIKDPQEKITKSSAFVMVPRSENFKKGAYHRMFVEYMNEVLEERKKMCWY